jgi:hypothetical protein
MLTFALFKIFGSLYIRIGTGAGTASNFVPIVGLAYK